MVKVNHVDASEHRVQKKDFAWEVFYDGVFFQKWRAEVLVSIFFFNDVDLRDYLSFAGVDGGVGESDEVVLWRLSAGFCEDVSLLNEDKGVLG